MAIDYHKEYPKDDEEFCGLYGYNMTYTNCNFIGKSNKFYLVTSEFKGQDRVYIANLENPNDLKYVKFLD